MIDSPVCWNRNILSVLWIWQGLQESKQDRKQRAPLETQGIASKGRPLVTHRRQPDIPTSEGLQPPQTTAPVWEQVLRRWVCDGDLNSKHNRGRSSKANHSWKHSKSQNQNYSPYIVRYSYSSQVYTWHQLSHQRDSVYYKYIWKHFFKILSYLLNV